MGDRAPSGNGGTRLGIQITPLGVALPVLLRRAEGVGGVATVTVLLGTGVALGSFLWVDRRPGPVQTDG